MIPADLQKSALRGEPSHVWRPGQQRRLEFILQAAGDRMRGRVLDNGCGLGLYLQHLQGQAGRVYGVEYEFERLQQAHPISGLLTCGAGENLPFPNASFNLVLSHEVLEHVQDDRQALHEIIRSLKPGGRLVLFVPNRGYPFETHGIYWRGHYHFGNKLFVNYLPHRWRDRLAPHVRAYSSRDLNQLFNGLPVTIISRTILFGGYDNLIERFKGLGKVLRAVLQFLERTPLRGLGLSHFWVVEKNGE